MTDTFVSFHEFLDRLYTFIKKRRLANYRNFNQDHFQSVSEAGKLWQEVPPGGSYTFTWDPSDGYIGVVTKTPEQILGERMQAYSKVNRKDP